LAKKSLAWTGFWLFAYREMRGIISPAGSAGTTDSFIGANRSSSCTFISRRAAASDAVVCVPVTICRSVASANSNAPPQRESASDGGDAVVIREELLWLLRQRGGYSSVCVANSAKICLDIAFQQPTAEANMNVGEPCRRDYREIRVNRRRQPQHKGPANLPVPDRRTQRLGYLCRFELYGCANRLRLGAGHRTRQKIGAKSLFCHVRPQFALAITEAHGNAIL
jgi:hypothetical protein